MHPYFVERCGDEHRKDLMREADRYRLAHHGAPNAHRWAKWWPLRRRARAGGPLVVVALAQAVAPAGAQPRLLGAGAGPAIGPDSPPVETVAAIEAPGSGGSLIDLERATEQLEHAHVL
jgi:hypothetical protein